MESSETSRVHFDLENIVTGGPCFLNPREILAELDRLGIRVWWSKVGGQERRSRTSKIRVPNSAPPELREAIRENNDELLKLMDRRKGGVPGIYYREPKPPPL